MQKKRIFFHLAAFAVFLTAGGFLSAYLKYELLYDFLQYHYYNGFAFWNNRLGVDIAAAAVPTYYNPLLDAATYFFFEKFRETPSVYYFIQGLPFGMMMFIFFETLLLFFDIKTLKGKICIAAALMIALTGFTVWFQIGTATNEIPVSVLVSGAVYLILKDNPGRKTFFFPGLLLGAAAGLKLTAAIYCVSSGITLLLMFRYLKNPFRDIGLFMLGGLAGFLLTNGFWMLILWREFQNPFFPFWNAVFKSPYFLESNYVDKLHLNGMTPALRLFLPFHLIIHPYYTNIAVMADLSDIRFAVVFIIGLLFCRGFLRKQKPVLPDRMKIFSLWLFVSYIVWIIVSANLRFTIPIETGCALIITAALARIKKPEKPVREAFYFSFLIILFGILLSTPSLSYYWGRQQSFTLLREKITLPDNTLLMTYRLPSAGFATEIVRMNPTAKILAFTKTVGWRTWNVAGYGKMRDKTEKALQEHENKAAFVIRSSLPGIGGEEDVPELKYIQGWKCRRLRKTKDIRLIFQGTASGCLQLCWPPEMDGKIHIQK